MFSLLEKKNGSVSDMQQAVFNKISTNSSNGIVEGYLNDFRIIKSNSNTITIDKGMISVQGYRIVNDVIESIVVNYVAQEKTRFQTILRLTIFNASENNTFEIISRPKQMLVQDNVYKTGSGVYEVELCNYNMTAAGITDFKVSIGKLEKTVVVGTTGQSTTNVMSQKAVTDELNKKQAKLSTTQINNINDVQNKQPKLSQTQINNINDVQNKQPKGDYATNTALNNGLKGKQNTLSQEQINNINDVPNKLQYYQLWKGSVGLGVPINVKAGYKFYIIKSRSSNICFDTIIFDMNRYITPTINYGNSVIVNGTIWSQRLQTTKVDNSRFSVMIAERFMGENDISLSEIIGVK